MKKILISIIFICSMLSLTSCASKKELDAALKENKELKEQIAEYEEIKEGEPMTLSGTLYIGTDIPAGSYDIKGDLEEEDSSVTIMVYENEETFKNRKQSDYELIEFGEEMKSYTLREGEIVNLVGDNVIFTRVK